MKVTYDRIYQIVKLIPPGFVTTYGRIARLAGIPGHARRVGYALSALKRDDVPWHRVVNAKGEISRRSRSGNESVQQQLLKEEGIAFDEKGRVSFDRFGWFPEAL